MRLRSRVTRARRADKQIWDETVGLTGAKWCKITGAHITRPFDVGARH